MGHPAEHLGTRWLAPTRPTCIDVGQRRLLLRRLAGDDHIVQSLFVRRLLEHERSARRLGGRGIRAWAHTCGRVAGLGEAEWVVGGGWDGDRSCDWLRTLELMLEGHS